MQQEDWREKKKNLDWCKSNLYEHFKKEKGKSEILKYMCKKYLVSYLDKWFEISEGMKVESVSFSPHLIKKNHPLYI